MIKAILGDYFHSQLYGYHLLNFKQTDKQID